MPGCGISAGHRLKSTNPPKTSMVKVSKSTSYLCNCPRPMFLIGGWFPTVIGNLGTQPFLLVTLSYPKSHWDLPFKGKHGSTLKDSQVRHTLRHSSSAQIPARAQFHGHILPARILETLSSSVFRHCSATSRVSLRTIWLCQWMLLPHFHDHFPLLLQTISQCINIFSV